MKSLDAGKPLVSVIMPTYNHGRFIGKAIDSVLNQTHKNLELIIIDNHSEDDTEKTVASYEDGRIIYLKFRNNGIIAASRNHGIEHSHGEYIAFLDSDDIWFPSKLDKQIPHFQNEGIVAVSTQALWIRGSSISRRYFRRMNRYIDYGYRDFLFRNYSMCSSVVVRKDVLLRLKGFDERKDFLCIEDWELWLRVVRLGKFRVLKEPLVFYRIESDKKWGAVEVSKRQFHIVEKQLHFGYISNTDADEARANISLSVAVNLLRIVNPESQEYFIQALKCSSNAKTKLKGLAGCFFASLSPRFLRVLLFIFHSLRSATYTRNLNRIYWSDS